LCSTTARRLRGRTASDRREVTGRDRKGYLGLGPGHVTESVMWRRQTRRRTRRRDLVVHIQPTMYIMCTRTAQTTHYLTLKHLKAGRARVIDTSYSCPPPSRPPPDDSPPLDELVSMPSALLLSVIAAPRVLISPLTPDPRSCEVLGVEVDRPLKEVITRSHIFSISRLVFRSVISSRCWRIWDRTSVPSCMEEY
jgi:hypothetical protein